MLYYKMNKLYAVFYYQQGIWNVCSQILLSTLISLKINMKILEKCSLCSSLKEKREKNYNRNLSFRNKQLVEAKYEI